MKNYNTAFWLIFLVMFVGCSYNKVSEIPTTTAVVVVADPDLMVTDSTQYHLQKEATNKKIKKAK
jgi:hypothetical protein